MKLTRSQISEIKEWCIERNHSKLVIPEELKTKITNAMGVFPIGKAMWYINEYWNTDVDIELTKEERDIVVHAVYENTAMEDARLPNNLLNRLLM